MSALKCAACGRNAVCSPFLLLPQIERTSLSSSTELATRTTQWLLRLYSETNATEDLSITLQNHNSFIVVTDSRLRTGLLKQYRMQSNFNYSTKRLPNILLHVIFNLVTVYLNVNRHKSFPLPSKNAVQFLWVYSSVFRMCRANGQLVRLLRSERLTRRKTAQWCGIHGCL